MKTLIIQNTLYTLSKKLFFFCVSMTFTALISCSNNDEDAAPDMSSDEKESVRLESQDNYYFDDTETIAMAAFISEEEGGAGGKVSTDARLTGAVVLRIGTFSSGSLKIDFGAGCTDSNGNVRKGVIIIDHMGRWNEEGAQWAITFSGYSMNGVAIEGTRKVMVVSVTEFAITQDVELINGKITWPDGSVATRACHFIREWERNVTQLLDRLIVYGEVQGTLRSGRGYTIEIKEELIFDRSCAESGVFIAVQGKKLIKHGSRMLTIDYGNGTCDNIVTLTNSAGISVQYEVSK
jgi:hypothetical protein